MKPSLFRFLPFALLSFCPLSADFVISEFMASNRTTLADEDGDFSDWIEVTNEGDALLDLEGWYLTDDVEALGSRWSFPSRFVAPGGSVVVFASGKDRKPVGAAEELHANFQLSASGEYLALIEPDGVSVATSFSPEYPQQEEDVSYGRGMATLATTDFVKNGDGGKVLVPMDGSLGLSWTGGGPLDDSVWQVVKTGVGFDQGGGPTGFNLVESFDSLNAGALDGQGGWSTSAATATVANDPADVDNQVMSLTADNVRTWKAMSIPDGQTSTLFYRVRREGIVDASIGSTDMGAPGTAFSDFETQFNNQKNDIWNVRDAGAFDPVDTFADNTWYEVWMVIDNASDTYEVHMKGGALTERTQLDAEAQMVFGFRNGSAANVIANFLARTGSGTTGALLIDDIYLGDGENLGNPASGSGLADFIDAEGDIELPMAVNSASAYFRMPFEVGDLNTLGSLMLRMRYDDGFIAYLNGTQIAAGNEPANVSWDSSAAGERANQDAIEFEEIDVTAFTDLLVANSTNVLAIHGLNVNAADGDFLISPELIGVAASETVELLYFTSPTPGQSNGSGFVGFVGDTSFSMDRGVYDQAITVVVDAGTEGATIIYTTDGSLPSPGNGAEVAAPASIMISQTTPLRAMAFKEGHLPTNVDTHTYIFPADILTQGNSPAGYPATWKGDGGNGTEIADYEMDPEITQSAQYGSIVDDALLSIPTISLVTDKGNLFDPATGIYQNPQQSGSAWERPVSFEIIHPNGVRQGIQVDAGIRIQGGHTRVPSKNPKHSFRLSFKREFGPTKLNYDLFPDDPDATKQFDQLILRGAGNQSWLHHNTFKGDNRGRAQYIRDQWAKDVQLAMGHPATRSMYAHLYINGIYWGMYNPTERGSAGFGESYLGGVKEDIDALNSGDAIDGENAQGDFSALMTFANGGLEDPVKYAQLSEMLDLESFTDYMMIQQYGANLDWDHHNWYILRNRNGGKWHFLSWDSEFVFISPTDNVLSLTTANNPSRIWRSLLANDEYRVLFADRVQKHLMNNGLLTPDAVTTMWDVRKDQMFDAIVAESARWGDYRRDVDPRGTPSPIPLYDRDGDWMTERTRLFDTYFPVRTDNVIAQYRAAGYLPSLEAPEFDVYGGRLSVGHPLEMNSGDGETIYYTTDGSDPRIPAEVSTVELIEAGAAMRVFVPLDNALGATWRGGAEPFDDSGWLSGTSVGYENSPSNYANLYDINVRDEMRGNSPSCLVRMTFTIPDQLTLDRVQNLTLGIRYDSGFVAFVNGVEVAQDNAPSVLDWDETGTSHNEALAVLFEPFDLGATGISALQVGENVLAMHGFNAGAGSSDFLLDAIVSVVLGSEVAISPGATLYTGTVPVNEPVLVRARVFDGSSWSALTEATFYTGVPASAANLVISEIMYNPDGSDETEFIEFQNIGADVIDLSGVRFSEGLDFGFPLGSALAPGAWILTVRNQIAFEALYGSDLPVAGVFLNDNSLDNGGDRLTLLAENDSVIRTFRYDDSAPWPEAADGGGSSLVLANPSGNPDHALAENWQASAVSGGTPGAPDSIAFSGVAAADDDGDGVSALLEFALGTSDKVAGDAGDAISFDVGGNFRVQRRAGVVGVSLEIETSTDLVTWQSADAMLQVTGQTNVAPGVVQDNYQWMGNGPQAFLRVKAIAE
ncbi:lamin tail domain-containing protein [Akkermansiaceae bacterium]|nr:lamin tail domain-containing protein [Akkermansiaceae bacterium]